MQSLQPVRRSSSMVGLVQRTSLISYIVNAVRTFGTPPKPVELFRPKPNLCRKSSINIRPKTKLAETVQIVVFGAETETETEFQSVSIQHAHSYHQLAQPFHSEVYNSSVEHFITKTLFFLLQFPWVCKPAYLVPVPSQDKLGGLCKEGHPA